MTSIVAQRAAKETTSLSACFTSEVMPRTVAMAPGPNMIGMATGRKATSSPTSAEWPVPRIMDVSEDGGEKRSKPMRLRMMPPTMRTMLSATAKIRRMSVPRRRGKHPEPGIDAGWTGRLDGAAVHPGLPEVQKDRQSFQGIDDRQECGEHADEVRERLLQAPTPFSRTVPVLLTRQGRACLLGPPHHGQTPARAACVVLQRRPVMFSEREPAPQGVQACGWRLSDRVGSGSDLGQILQREAGDALVVVGEPPQLGLGDVTAEVVERPVSDELLHAADEVVGRMLAVRADHPRARARA